MMVKIYNLKEEEPCLRLLDVVTAVSKVERPVDGDTGKEMMVIFANGNKKEYSMPGLAFVFFEDDTDPEEWQLRKAGEQKNEKK